MPKQLHQEGGTCWFYSILNAMILSKFGRRVLLKKVNAFYRSLSQEQKALFDNKYLCLKATPQNRGFVFLKFVMSFWKGKTYRGKTKKLIMNLGINENKAGNAGAFPNIEREKMLKTLKIPYSVMYSDKPEKFKGPGARSEMVIVRDSKSTKSIKMFDTTDKDPVLNIPLTLPGYPSYELDHAVLGIEFITMASHYNTPNVGEEGDHAISCIRLPNGEYRIVEPNGNQDPCVWTNPASVGAFFRNKWYKRTYGWNIVKWGYDSFVYVKNDSKLPKFDIGKEAAATAVTLGVNKEGHKILVGPRGGRYVQLAVGKEALPKTVRTPQSAATNGKNTQGRVIYKGPEGARYVIVVGKDGKRYKRYMRKIGPVAPVKTPPKKKPVGTNAKGRAIYKGVSGGRYVIVTGKDGKRYKKYMPKQK